MQYLLNNYIGIPFKEHGDTIAGVDCWGLVRLVYRDLLNIELPAYHDVYSTCTDRKNINKQVERSVSGWLTIGDADRQLLDVVLIKIGKYKCHVGVYGDCGMIVHAAQDKEAVVAERLNSKKYRDRVEGYYRYNGN